MSREGVPRVKKEDRLFSLILALVSSREGLTKNEILKTVRGYSDSFDYKGNATLDKMFERDKDEIRTMGVIIDTLELPEEEGQTHNVRYSISRSNYDFPPGLVFSSDELTLLNLAAQAWREGSLSADSRHALTKIKSLGVSASDSLIGVAPRIRTNDRAFAAIEDALENQLILTFSYLKPGQPKAQSRTASPLAMLSWNGLWYVMAYDFDAAAERTFLLQRIVSTPLRVPQKTHPRLIENYATRLQEELEELTTRNTAHIVVVDGSDAQLRLAARYQLDIHSTNFHFGFSDFELLADDLLLFGSDVLVIEPPALISAVKNRLDLIYRSSIGESS
jgi:proteasome accessory factor B